MNPRALHFGAEEVDLRDVVFTPESLASVPAQLARRHHVLPVLSSPGKLRLALPDPSDLEAIDTLHAVLRRDLELVVAQMCQIEEFISRLYGPEGAREG